MRNEDMLALAVMDDDGYGCAITSTPAARNTARHIATSALEGTGYLVTCPHGCNLGTSARVPDARTAAVRIRLHSMATTPLHRTNRQESR